MREVSSIAFSQLLATDGFARGVFAGGVDGSMISALMAKAIADPGQSFDSEKAIDRGWLAKCQSTQ